uniref:Peptidase S1 domain-containing protein n=1 Tax=Timema cristinae TaxID=61476 RepID=A0A7R9H5T0_TIMCR|nr:unnamed protein product [Timema cristinae]
MADGMLGSRIGTTTVHLGSQNLNSVEAGKVTVTTRSHVNHANYDTNNLNNDISLLRLPFSITLGSFIQVVALPRHSQDSNTFADQAVQVSGWGRTSDTSTGISAELNFVDLNIITNAVCAQTYGTDVIIGSTMCASGAGGRSTCNLSTGADAFLFQGDSGGPLVITQEGSYLQIGVVSFVSSAGCASGNPSGYVRTTSFLNWISANTQISIAD